MSLHLTQVLSSFNSQFQAFRLRSSVITAIVILAVFPANAAEVDQTKPVQVYVLAGQSNMLEMGNVSGGNSRHSEFFQSAAADAEKGVEVSVYEGGYDPAADYDKMEAKATKTVIYDGLAKDPFPSVDGAVTYVARGFVEIEATGVYEFSPGYGGSTENITEVNGTEVYRKEPGGEAVRVALKMKGGKRYPFKTTFFTKAANSLFWIGRTDIPGTLDTVVKQDEKFPYLLGDDGKWVVRDDVLFQDARLHGGWDWAPDDRNKMVLDEAKLKAACKPLTVEKGVWVGVPFGHLLGEHHDEQVLIIRTAIGNRGLAWDFRPPSSGKLPDIADDLKRWEGVEYKMMIEGVQKSLEHIAELVPGYKNQGYELNGLVWFQGHKDTGGEEHAKAYEQNLVNLINDVRKDLETPKLPVVVATIGFNGREMESHTKTVWEAQMAIGDSEKHPEFSDTVKVVDTRDFWRSPEVSPSAQGYHYNRNAETYMLIGEAIGREMIDFISAK